MDGERESLETKYGERESLETKDGDRESLVTKDRERESLETKHGDRERMEARQECRVQKQDNGTPPDFGLSRELWTGRGSATSRQRSGTQACHKYRRFVPADDLLRKGSRWEWTPEHQMAFEEVKARLVADLVLACPDFSRTFILQTDASDYGIGAILTHDTEKGERVISYSSRTLNGAEKNYSSGSSGHIWKVTTLR